MAKMNDPPQLDLKLLSDARRNCRSRAPLGSHIFCRERHTSHPNFQQSGEIVVDKDESMLAAQSEGIKALRGRIAPHASAGTLDGIKKQLFINDILSLIDYKFPKTSSIAASELLLRDPALIDQPLETRILIALVVFIFAFCSLFVLGTFEDTKLAAKEAFAGKLTPWSFLILLSCWTWSNLLYLCLLASLIGETGRHTFGRRQTDINFGGALVEVFSCL